MITSDRRADLPVRLIERAPSAHYGALLLKHLLRSGVTRSPDQEIVYRDRLRYTYRDLEHRVARLANVLGDIGVTAGQTVAMLDWDSHRYLECYFAVPGIGAVLHMVNIRLSHEQILYTINHARDDLLLVHSDFIPLIEDIWDRIEQPAKIILMSDDGAMPATALPFVGEYEAMLAAVDSSYAFPDFDEDACATTFYTTGTTGLPKGVNFSHRQLVLHTLGTATVLASATEQGRLHRSDVYMPLTPMFHVHAWGLPFIATMLGLKQVYPGRYDPEMIYRLRHEESVTFSHGVPTLLQMVLNNAPSGADLSGWKFIVGGSLLSAGLARAALDRGMDVFTGYGMSETCPIITLAQLDPADLRDDDNEIALRTKAGRPSPLVELRIVDEQMQDVPHDGSSTGEVVVRSPWLTQAYVGDPANSEKLWAGGYLHTADIGSIDGRGFLKVTDRIKDVIKSGGEWVSSLEIEDLISRHPDVGEVAVIGIPDDRWGERPVALVVPKPGASSVICLRVVRDHLQPYCDRGIISKWAMPAKVLQVDQIEKTSVGKLDKKLLRERHGGICR